MNYECASKIPCIVPSFASRGPSWLCGAWRLWRWMKGTQWGQGYNRPTGCSAEKPPHATFNFYTCWLTRECLISWTRAFLEKLIVQVRAMCSRQPAPNPCAYPHEWIQYTLHPVHLASIPIQSIYTYVFQVVVSFRSSDHKPVWISLLSLFFLHSRPDRLWGPPSLLINGNGFLSKG